MKVKLKEHRPTYTLAEVQKMREAFDAEDWAGCYRLRVFDAEAGGNVYSVGAQYLPLPIAEDRVVRWASDDGWLDECSYGDISEGHPGKLDEWDHEIAVDEDHALSCIVAAIRKVSGGTPPLPNIVS